MDIAAPPSHATARAQIPFIAVDCPPKYNWNLIILRNNCFLDFRPVLEQLLRHLIYGGKNCISCCVLNRASLKSLCKLMPDRGDPNWKAGVVEIWNTEKTEDYQSSFALGSSEVCKTAFKRCAVLQVVGKV